MISSKLLHGKLQYSLDHKHSKFRVYFPPCITRLYVMQSVFTAHKYLLVYLIQHPVYGHVEKAWHNCTHSGSLVFSIKACCAKDEKSRKHGEQHSRNEIESFSRKLLSHCGGLSLVQTTPTPQTPIDSNKKVSF